jgi:hypothetical protein
MSSADWYAKRLGNQTPRESVPPSMPAPREVYTPPARAANVQVSYDQTRDQLVTKAQSSRQQERCPGCYSVNYMAPPGSTRQRCYDCGYPLVQAGTGAGMPSESSGPVQAARQPSKGTGFNPNIIVDRIQ